MTTSLLALLSASATAREPGGLAGRVVASLGEAEYSVVGEATLEQRVQRFFASVTLGRHDAETVAEVTRMTAGCPADDLRCRLGASFYGLRGRLAYRADDQTLDRYAPLIVALRLVHVDCSSMGVAVDTVAAILGVPVAACTVKQRNPRTGEDEWCHVYGVAWAPARIGMDLSERVPIGWEPQSWRVRERRDWLYDRAAWDRWYAEGAVGGREPAVYYSALM